MAAELDISERTLAYWLNVRYFEELQKIGYQKAQKKLTPKQVSWLNSRLVMIQE